MAVEIQVYLRQRRARVILHAERVPNTYTDFPIDEALITGDDTEDAQSVALQLVDTLTRDHQITATEEVRIISIVNGRAN